MSIAVTSQGHDSIVSEGKNNLQSADVSTSYGERLTVVYKNVISKV